MNFPASQVAVRQMTADCPDAHLKLVEDKANGSAVIQSLKEEIVGFKEVNPEGGKVARAAAASVALESGNWYLPHPMLYPWVGDPESPADKEGFLRECILFPHGSNDDQVDAWSQAEVYLQKESAGNVFGVTESDIRVDPFDLKLIEKWPRLYGVSITWHEIAAIWMARQPETGQHYFYAEYCAPAGDPAQHAAAINKLGRWPGYMTAEEVGRDAKDGYALATKYNSLGLIIETTRANDEAFLVDFTEALKTGKLKIFGNCARFFDQFRSFLRKDGKLPVYNRGVIDAAMVAWKSRDRMKKPMEPAKPEPLGFNDKMQQGSTWMGS
jgi:predicted phage terminase large subunit-like protein